MAYKSLRNITARLRELGKHAMPFSTTFTHGIPQENKALVERQLREAFQCWWESWILPEIELLESKIAASEVRKSLVRRGE